MFYIELHQVSIRTPKSDSSQTVHQIHIFLLVSNYKLWELFVLEFYDIIEFISLRSQLLDGETGLFNEIECLIFQLLRNGLHEVG